MAYFIRGDVHEKTDWLYQFQGDKGDTLILLGDIGCILWTEANDAFMDEIAAQPFQILALCGNHCNYDLLRSYPQEHYRGGLVYKLRRNLRILQTGQFYTFNSYRCLVVDGAQSIDKWMRTEGISWWPGEIPSKSQLEVALDNIYANYGIFDFLLSHTCAISTKIELLGFEDSNPDAIDSVSNFLEFIKENCAYKLNYCGHFHEDIYLPQHLTQVLYEETIKLGDTINER